MIQIGIIVMIKYYPDLQSCQIAQAEIEKVIQYNPRVITQCIRKSEDQTS